MKHSRSVCPICGQHNMDFHAITYRNHPYIDGVKYPKMCFGCAHVPVEYIQRYNGKGEIEEEFGPFFDYKHLATAQELFEQGSTESLAEAQKCIAGVRRRIKEVGVVALKKLKLKRPSRDYDCDHEPEKPEKSGRKIRKKRVSKSEPEPTQPVNTDKKRKVKLGAKKAKHLEDIWKAKKNKSKSS